MVASYDKNTEYSAHDPDGVCLVWNTRFKKNTPEHVFHCQSPVTVTTFAKFHPHLIIGGTYSGQVPKFEYIIHQDLKSCRSYE